MKIIILNLISGGFGAFSAVFFWTGLVLYLQEKNYFIFGKALSLIIAFVFSCFVFSLCFIQLKEVLYAIFKVKDE